MLQKIRAAFGAKLLAWQAPFLIAPVLLSVTTFGLVMYAQPMPAHPQSSLHKTADKIINMHHAVAISKAAQAVAHAPQVAIIAPSPAPAAPVKTPVRAVATAKPEPVVTPSPSSSVSGLTPTTPPPSSSPAPSSQIATGYTSTNWSGYLAANASLTGVSGSWTATNPSGNGSTTSADSTWIGIGGVTSGDLIQVGTQNIISASGQVSASAFYELLPNVSQPVPGVTVSPGDSLTASISQVSSGQWSISITDKTDGQSATFTVAYASSLSSAEWIEEDPSFSSRRQIPFDNFHGAAFTAAAAIANGSTANLAGSTAQPVTMVNNIGQIIALPSAIGGDGASFTVSP
ncbi:MAG TPA: G1 family glutamic endopeptidase [Candidatus Saccharimonadales bacterium]